MRMLMPSHAKNVKPYKAPVALFQRYQIESQLDAMFMPTVTLKSGGYIVINQTEALVSIDVNSGKATREHSIEDTAHKTNLEAAEEISRQLRLRDLAGLIVIDFIDMEDPRNDRNVEKRLRDCIKCDRARVQIGKISQFGLLEMSRQRLRAGVVAGSTIPCPHCGGQGIVRSVESTALRLLRGLEEEAQRQRAATLSVRAPTGVAIYALNQKRHEIAHLEAEYGLAIQFDAKDDLMAGTFEIDRIGVRPPEERARPASPLEPSAPAPIADATDSIEPPDGETAAEPPAQAEGQSDTPNIGKRRRRRRRGRDRERTPALPPQEIPQAEAIGAPIATERWALESAIEPALPSNQTGAAEQVATEQGSSRKRRRRRRGRRGSRENGSSQGQDLRAAQQESPSTAEPTPRIPPSESGPDSGVPDLATWTNVPNTSSEPVWSLSSEGHADSPHPQASREHIPASEAEPQSTDDVGASGERPSPVAGSAPNPSGPPRRGWWQRPFRARE
ncbi:MAG TPA: ribonuclease E/G, partial [Rhizomicrobium sp.]